MFCCKNAEVVDDSTTTEIILTETEKLEIDIIKSNKLVKNKDEKKFLCSGGFGSVFIFTNVIANQKLIEKRGKLRHIHRTLLEAKTLIDLNGLFCPQFFMFTKLETYTNLTMEYMPGQDLYEYFTLHTDEIDYEWIKYIIASISVALICIFNRGYMHLDLKLENIMYNPELKTITLVDWGSSHRATTRLKRIKYNVGTKDYCAPEIYLRHYYSTSDIFSLGCIFWILLAGKYPYNLENHKFAYAQISDEFPSSESEEAFNLLNKEQKTFLKATLKKDWRERMTYPQLEKVEFINNYINNLNL